ncbi:hypothetical protein [Streptomyces sp. NPDC126514]|uniref:hypothetical protein n=1 Tax=Streptomyces sp. NPDC126514 TaxID=3155210 RepID=UPI00331CDBBB
MPRNESTPAAAAFAGQCNFGTGEAKAVLQKFVNSNQSNIPNGEWPWPAPLQSLREQLTLSESIDEMPSTAWQGVFLAYVSFSGRTDVLNPPYHVDDALWDWGRKLLLDLVVAEIANYRNEAINVEQKVQFGTGEIALQVSGFADKSANVNAAINKWLESTGKEADKLVGDLNLALSTFETEHIETLGVVLVRMRTDNPERGGIADANPRFLPSVWKAAVLALLDEMPKYYQD